MRWLALFLVPMILWGGLFSAVYGLHGLGCAWGWPALHTPLGSLHLVAMVAVWLGGLALHSALVRAAPERAALADRLLRLSAWIGLLASVLTLWPVLVLTSCPAPL